LDSWGLFDTSKNRVVTSKVILAPYLLKSHSVIKSDGPRVTALVVCECYFP